MDAMEARFYAPEPDGTADCRLCPHGCHIPPGGHGRCRVRTNQDGTLWARSYGCVTALALDPIEKKPLRRFHPGSRILSVGSWGCNLGCAFCQNWSLSQGNPPGETMTPDDLVALAVKTKAQGNIGLAYTYSEPSVCYEFIADCAPRIRQKGLKNVLVTNGYINREPMEALLPYIDAMNIDLKAFRPAFYREVCGGRLEPVMDTIRLCTGACPVEVTTLLIPGMNDGEAEVAELSAWLASLSPDIPLHLTRYHPDYRMQEPPATPPETVLMLADVARRSLQHVYCGNL